MSKNDDELVIDAHTVSVSDLVNKLGTNLETGLTSAQAKDGLNKHGPNKMNNSLETSIKVLRDGNQVEIKVTEITVGDIVILESGDNIPADIRIFKSDGLKVDKSNLTGDSEPQEISPDFSHDNPLQTQNLVFSGTNAVEGSGVGIVFAVGMKTCMGRVSGLSSTFPL